MTERTNEPVPTGLLDALRERRGECPPLELLLEPERAGADDCERIERHVELCPTCAGIVEPAEGDVDDVTWNRVAAELDGRERPWAGSKAQEQAPQEKEQEKAAWRGRRPLLALAAAVLALLGGLAVWRTVWQGADPAEGVPAASGVARGAVIQGLEPVGSLESADSLEIFRWRMPAPLEVELHVEVQRGDAPLWSGVATGGSLEAPASLRDQLAPGAYRWRVTGVDERGAVVARSAWVEFRIE